MKERSPILVEIGRRISSVRGDVGRIDAAKRWGVHHNTLERYEKGERGPDTEFLLALTQEGVSAHWVLTGEGPRMSKDLGGPQSVAPFSIDVLRQAVETVEEGLAATGRTMRADKKAELVAAVYDLFAESEGKIDKGVVLRLVKSAS